jgi:hypothetical protein
MGFSSLVSEDDCAADHAAMAIMKSAEAAYDLRQPSVALS